MRKGWRNAQRLAGLCLLGSLCCYPATAGAQMTTASSTLHREAVQLARGGNYAKSLQIMQQLEQETDEGYWADYLVILSWAGQEKQLVALADKHYQGDFSRVPDYALRPLAQAYEKAGQTDKAASLCKRLQDMDPLQDYMVSYEQGVSDMGRKDYVAAEQNFAQARQLATAAGDKGIRFVRDMDARRAALYIQQGEYDRSVIILRPYVEKGTASVRMLSDYLMALRFDNRAREAKLVFRQKCPDWSKMPAYGLQTMGDLYLRAGRYRQAHALYAYILQKNDIDYVRLGDAYALAMLGHDQAAVAQYAAAVKRYPNRQPAVAGDAAAFLQQGRLGMARQLFNLLGTTPAERENWQLQYGQQLTDVADDLRNAQLNFKRDERLDGRSYYHEADKVLRPLLNSSSKDIRQSAAADLALNKLHKGLFASVDHQLAALLDSPSADDPVIMAVSGENERRQEHALDSYYRARLDNKRNHESDFGLSYTNYLGQNWYAMAGYGYSWLQDGQNHAQYAHGDVGLSWHYDRGQVDVTYDRFGSGWDLNGYTLFMSYEPNDVAVLSFGLGHRPHAHAGAIAQHIDENYHTISWDQILGSRWRFGADYEWDNLSDGNDYWSYGVNFVDEMSQRHNYRDNLLLGYNYGHYDQQTDGYDSPYRRIDYGFGFSRKWNLPQHNRSWEWINMLSWGHDDDEGMGFSPYTRVEWTQALQEGQSLTIGAQYNWYFNQIATTDQSRRNNGYLVDVNYSLGW